jgi:hypothetical protein
MILVLSMIPRSWLVKDLDKRFERACRRPLMVSGT